MKYDEKTRIICKKTIATKMVAKPPRGLKALGKMRILGVTSRFPIRDFRINTGLSEYQFGICGLAEADPHVAEFT